MNGACFPCSDQQLQESDALLALIAQHQNDAQTSKIAANHSGAGERPIRRVLKRAEADVSMPIHTARIAGVRSPSTQAEAARRKQAG
jgi:hypothetical protein